MCSTLFVPSNIQDPESPHQKTYTQTMAEEVEGKQRNKVQVHIKYTSSRLGVYETTPKHSGTTAYYISNLHCIPSDIKKKAS